MMARMTEFMQLALDLAAKAQYLTAPNPAVGCVLVCGDQIIGSGHTQAAGAAHAEVMALRDAQAQGFFTDGKLPPGTTAYVTLEPCNHQGRTGPCSHALVQAGVAGVVAANQDPNPLVAGQGMTTLAAAGVQTHVLPPDHALAIAAREVYIGFWQRMTTGLPWVRAKSAASLDGFTALQDGTSQWITGEAARADGHAWRARACAVLTGIGTVLADDPRLDVRHVTTPRQPGLVLVDSHLDVPLSAGLFKIKRPIWIYCALPQLDAPDAQAAAKTRAQTLKISQLQQLGAEVVCLPNQDGKVDLLAMLQDLGRRQINELHVEAGFKLNGSLANAGLINEWLIYLAPLLLGEGMGIAKILPPASLQAARRLALQSITPLGQDLRVLARTH